MEPHSRVLIEELGDASGLVGRQVVQHNVDLFRPRGSLDDLRHKGQEVFAGMASGSLAMNLAGFHVQCRVERERPVAVVFESMLFCPAR